jgi:tight adherence protein B
LEFKDPIADQVCETLEIARRNGGRDTTLILRTLGDFVRNDIALRSEIRAKHGWIKNSAIIATLAPWILLLILSSQPTTIAAFSTATGVFVLIMGALMSIAGFLWMSRIGRIQEIPRVFRGAIPQKSDVISHE